MQCNVGGGDRNFRIGLGIALIVIALLWPLGAGWQAALFVLAAVAIVTGALRFCLLYKAFGMDTCQRGERREHPG